MAIKDNNLKHSKERTMLGLTASHCERPQKYAILLRRRKVQHSAFFISHMDTQVTALACHRY
jgi:hypothetical protein